MSASRARGTAPRRARLRCANFFPMHEWQVWFVAALLLFVAEMIAPGFWLLSVAVGSLAAGVVALVLPGVVAPALTFAAGPPALPRGDSPLPAAAPASRGAGHHDHRGR